MDLLPDFFCLFPFFFGDSRHFPTSVFLERRKEHPFKKKILNFEK